MDRTIQHHRFSCWLQPGQQGSLCVFMLKKCISLREMGFTNLIIFQELQVCTEFSQFSKYCIRVLVQGTTNLLDSLISKQHQYIFVFIGKRIQINQFHFSSVHGFPVARQRDLFWIFCSYIPIAYPRICAKRETTKILRKKTPI